MGERPAAFVPVGSLVITVSLLAAACVAAPSPFERTATSIDGDLASARSAIALVHEGRLTVPFARASIVEIRASLADAPDQLAHAPGAPPNADVGRVVDAVRQASKAASAPCLDASCDWRAQLATIDAARRALEALVPAGGS